METVDRRTENPAEGEIQYKITVEENGKDGFSSYRVPGITAVSDGGLLLTYEGRSEKGSERTLFLRRLQPGHHGRLPESFGSRLVMAEPKAGELLHNPLLIAGLNGRVYFFWCQDYGRLFMRISDDNGRNFGAARELTAEIDGFRENWPVTLWAIAPGHGICKKDGTVVLPLWLSRGENAHLPAAFACLYSKDEGKTWRCSNVVPAGNGVGDPTEASVAERRDGTLLATMRHEIRGVRRRAFCEEVMSGNGRAFCGESMSGDGKAFCGESMSGDGKTFCAEGIHWSSPWLDENLPDPVCSGALLSLRDGRMAFVNCAYGDEPALERQKKGEDVRWSLDARQRLTLRLSEDDGRTWSEGLLLEQESGASDLAQGADGALYCFYEEGWENGNCIFNRRLKLCRVKLQG